MIVFVKRQQTVKLRTVAIDASGNRAIGVAQHRIIDSTTAKRVNRSTMPVANSGGVCPPPNGERQLVVGIISEQDLDQVRMTLEADRLQQSRFGNPRRL